MFRQLFTNFFGQKSRQIPEGVYFNAFEIDMAEEYVKIVPIGDFPNHHSGPHSIEPRHIEQMANNIKAAGTDILFDYGHESLWSSLARAAGWSPKDSVEAREDGLYIRRPTWTTKGREAIENGEYRYFSPVYRLYTEGKDGTQIGATLHSVGLVNKPYMDKEIDHVNSEVIPMFSKALLNSLNLPEGATEEQVISAIEEAKKNAAQPSDPESAAPSQEPEGEPASPQTDPVLVEIQKINGRLDGIEQARATSREQEIEAVLNSAVADFRILPADKDAWRDALKANFDERKAALLAKPKNSAKPGKVEVAEDGDQGKTKVNAVKAAVGKLKDMGRYPYARAN